jgi:hypothetical protein
VPLRSQLLSEVRSGCDGLPDAPLPQGLPSHLIWETLVAIESEMLRDHDLAGSNRRVTQTDLYLDTDLDSVPVAALDFHAPTHAYLQDDPASEFWWPVEIVDLSSLGEMAAQGHAAIAIAGNPPSVHFSWTADSGQMLRLWYERGANETPQLGDYSEIGGLYDEYLKLMTIAQCREYAKLPIGDVLKARLLKSERQWQRYVNRGHQQGLGHKAPSYNSRFRRRYSMVDRTRYFVP